ncbi:alpha/beta hydrolase [Uliginosibacterium sp. sgz301328]|uniref:alpha/beta hydrolase n=1 Tax=Uliginosibacterium sp. sgz301328 TaxID=3243764 RepID=UPI00359DF836
MPVHPKARQLLDMLHRIEAPRLFEQPLDIARHNYHKLLYAYRGELEHVASISDLELPRRELAGGPLVARLYRTRTDALQPVVLWFHGGGWTLGDVAGYDGVCRSIARRADCAVLAVDYRLAPENAFPAAVDDAWMAWRWAQQHGAEHGLDAARVTVAGDSAGANLAAVLSLMTRDAGGVQPRLQVLVYPSTDQLSEAPSHARWGEGHFLDRDSIAWFQRNYLPSSADYLDWRASPLRATDHRGLAPALVVSAECDPLVDDVIAYGNRLEGAGVPVRHVCYLGMIHGFLSMARLFAATDDALDEIAQAVRGASSAMPQ